MRENDKMLAMFFHLEFEIFSLTSPPRPIFFYVNIDIIFVCTKISIFTLIFDHVVHLLTYTVSGGSWIRIKSRYIFLKLREKRWKIEALGEKKKKGNKKTKWSVRGRK